MTDQKHGSGTIVPNVNPRLTPFIGRETELQELIQRVQLPECRLLTLVGPGGIGKTRLAVEAATRLTSHFAQGYCFVDLQTAKQADQLIQVIADALHFPGARGEDLLAQLCTHLSTRQLLLILDNFDHLVTAHSHVSTLLAETVGLKIIITSRETLNLHEEWVYVVNGLSVPGDGEQPPHRADAVRLFAETARRVRPDFSLDDELPAVVRIAQAVEGMPLALELAASWRRTLNCDQIAEAIARELDFLTGRQRNLPERHRSIQAVFDQTYGRLSEAEADVFRRLSVFSGSFSAAAAASVAGASLDVLSALVDKSLLYADVHGRYHLHRLLRQFSAERLAQTADAETETRQRHAETYLRLVADCEAALLGGDQQEAAVIILAELENIRAAWGWAVERADTALLERGAIGLAQFYQLQSRYLEAVDTFEAASTRLENAPTGDGTGRVQALILAYQAAFYVRVGRLDDAAAVIDRCAALHARLQLAPLPGIGTDPNFVRGLLAMTQGDYTTALTYGEAMRHVSVQNRHEANLQLACFLLASAAIGLGDYNRGREYAEQAHALAQRRGDRWFTAYTFNQLGDIAHALQDEDTAAHHYSASMEIREAFGDREGVALAFNRLGELALRRGDAARAGVFFERSVAIYQEVNDRGGLAQALSGSACAALANGELASAGRWFEQALRVAAELGYVPVILSTLAGIGELLMRAGQADRASQVLTAVLAHPALGDELRRRIHTLFNTYPHSLPAGDTAPLAVPALVANLLLRFPDVQPANAPPAPRPTTRPSRQSLVEPLSERELEVLRCVAEGLRNREIADRLYVAVSTVKAHINNIYRKLDVTNRVQALARARELGLL